MVFCGRGGVGGGCGWGLFSDRTNRTPTPGRGGEACGKRIRTAHVTCTSTPARDKQTRHGERTKTNRPPLLAAALRTPHLTPNAKGDQRLPRLGKSSGAEAEKTPGPSPSGSPPQRCQKKAFLTMPELDARAPGSEPSQPRKPQRSNEPVAHAT